MAAWDGLSGETHILILSRLNEITMPVYLRDKIARKALDGKNTYIRYLAAKTFNFYDSSEELNLIRQKIENDAEPLVKYSLLESEFGFLDGSKKDCDSFFSLPHKARLAKVRLLEGEGEKIATLMSRAIDQQLKKGSVTELELYEILSDYVVKAEFHQYFAFEPIDGYGEYQQGKDLESLWKLIPKLPESLSYILLENLPEGSVLQVDIPDAVITALSDRQLVKLLSRKNIGLKKLRKKLFWQCGKGREHLRTAATMYNFSLDYHEFKQILEMPEKERTQLLKELGVIATQLTLCLYDAIHDALLAADVGIGDYEEGILSQRTLECRLEEISDEQRENELTELRLHRLANEIVPWDKKEESAGDFPEALEFLSDKVVTGDTWATFMGFSEGWKNRPLSADNLDYHLPIIYEDLYIDDVINETPALAPNTSPPTQ